MELPKDNDKKVENDERDIVLQTLTKPGTRLIMPDEETKIRNGEATSPRIFDTFRSSGKSKKSNPHEVGYVTFARVYANSLAESEITKFAPKFPVGAIIVREKYLKETDLVPETVTAMVKREKGFSKKTNDWEFFTLNGRFLTLQKRETKGDCAKCHSQVENTDFVFKTYLK